MPNAIHAVCWDVAARLPAALTPPPLSLRPPPPPASPHACPGRPPPAMQVLLEANAMVICSLIHASILKIGRSYVSSTEEADFMARARQFVAGWVGGWVGGRGNLPGMCFFSLLTHACSLHFAPACLQVSRGRPPPGAAPQLPSALAVCMRGAVAGGLPHVLQRRARLLLQHGAGSLDQGVGGCCRRCWAGMQAAAWQPALESMPASPCTSHPPTYDVVTARLLLPPPPPTLPTCLPVRCSSTTRSRPPPA